MTDRSFPAPTGSLTLRRRPEPPDGSPLQAWDGADRLLIEELPSVAGPVWVLNDRFGALAAALVAADRTVVSMTDSVATRLATVANLQANQMATDAVDFVAPVDEASVAVGAALAPPAIVIGRFPRSHTLLDHELSLLGSHLADDTVVHLGVMAKHLRRPHVEHLERGLGRATVSLASHKARIVSFELSSDRRPPPIGPARFTTDQAVEAVGLPGVFSRERLDPGARALLGHLDLIVERDPTDILDLGCGNGVLGATIAGRLPFAEVTFADESHLAVASAAATSTATGLDPERCHFLTADRLDDVAAGSFDLVVCNPPFHQEQVIGDLVAWNMFHDARRILRPGGRLAVVANRHLGHHTRLKRLFGSVRTVSEDPKFVVLIADREG